MKKKNILLALLFLILFVLVMILVVLGKTTVLDKLIYDNIIAFRNPFLDGYFINITKLGNTTVVFGIVLLFILIVRNRYGLFLACSSIDTVLLNLIVKYSIKRPRPTELRLITQGGYSFPSGHAMISVGVYGYLLYLAITKIKNKVLKYFVSIVLFMVILSIGISRIYVGVHYASDVIAGYLLALCYLIFFIEVQRKVNFKWR